MKYTLIFCLLTFPFSVSAQDAQWRGPNRDGIFPDTLLMDRWPSSGPDLLFKIDGIGLGWSSAVADSGIIYVAGKVDTLDVLSAFDMLGNKRWSTAFGRSWKGSYDHSRNTPVVEGERVYVISGMGEVVCLDTHSGTILWKRNPHLEFRGVLSYWGFAESLLITGEAVIYTVGGKDASVVALNKETGALVWATPPVNDARAYASPTMIERNGNRIILVELEQNLLGINPLDGALIWTYSLLPDSADLNGMLNHANSPLYHDGEIFITRGYDIEAVMLSLSDDGRSVQLKWKNRVLDTHIGGVVLVDGFIYGSNWSTNTQGNWVCIDWDTGEVMYEHEWFTKGPIIFADGHLYCMDEKRGNVALVAPDPAGFKVVSSFRIQDGAGPFWAHPTIYNRQMLIRHGDLLLVYDLRERNL